LLGIFWMAAQLAACHEGLSSVRKQVSSRTVSYLSNGVSLKILWGTLIPRINVENACILQINLYVFLYIRAVVWHLTLFLWVYYYNHRLLTSKINPLNGHGTRTHDLQACSIVLQPVLYWVYIFSLFLPISIVSGTNKHVYNLICRNPVALSLTVLLIFGLDEVSEFCSDCFSAVKFSLWE
jgi:hypothetical protein